ncbi:unnamed protein product, partial [Vitis vinifera]
MCSFLGSFKIFDLVYAKVICRFLSFKSKALTCMISLAPGTLVTRTRLKKWKSLANLIPPPF